MSLDKVPYVDLITATFLLDQLNLPPQEITPVLECENWEDINDRGGL